MAMSFANGDVFYHTRLNNMVNASKDNGVLSGLDVTAQTTPSLTLDVAAGQCHVDNETYVESSATTVIIGTAHATLPRLDIVCYDTSAGVAAVTPGTAASVPQPPDIPVGDILLALISVPALDTTISSGQITDEIIIVRPVGFVYVSSSNVITSLDGEEANNSTTYTKEKELDPIPDDIFSNESELSIMFTLKSQAGFVTVYGRVYRNGVAVGTEQSTLNTNYVPYYETITGWSAGDLIQIYTRTTNASYSAYTYNFRVRGDPGFKSVYSW